MAAWDRFWRHGVSVSRRFGTAGGRIAWGGGFMGWVSLYGLAFDGSIRFGGMECHSFDGRVGRHKFVMGVGCFFPWAYAVLDQGALGRRNIGEFGAA